jgi:hypothetical protein
MVVIVLFVLSHKPRLSLWTSVLFGLVLIRFFFGEFLKEKTSWYLLVSYPLTGIVLLIVIVNLLRGK